MEFCRCDGSPMNGSDHCPRCFCEQYEERSDCEWMLAEMDRFADRAADLYATDGKLR